jgi:hypothetical protein
VYTVYNSPHCPICVYTLPYMRLHIAPRTLSNSQESSSPSIHKLHPNHPFNFNPKSNYSFSFSHHTSRSLQPQPTSLFSSIFYSFLPLLPSFSPTHNLIFSFSTHKNAHNPSNLMTLSHYFTIS